MRPFGNSSPRPFSRTPSDPARPGSIAWLSSHESVWLETRRSCHPPILRLLSGSGGAEPLGELAQQGTSWMQRPGGQRLELLGERDERAAGERATLLKHGGPSRP